MPLLSTLMLPEAARKASKMPTKEFYVTAVGEGLVQNVVE